MKTMLELKQLACRCRHCGSAPLLVNFTGDRFHPKYTAHCLKCNLWGPLEDSRYEAITSWNTYNSTSAKFHGRYRLDGNALILIEAYYSED